MYIYVYKEFLYVSVLFLYRDRRWDVIRYLRKFLIGIKIEKRSRDELLDERIINAGLVI